MAARNLGGRPKGLPKTGGRQRGTPNRVTRDIRQLAQRMVTDKRYLSRLRARLRDGTAGPIEVVLHHYAWGKPHASEDTTPTEQVVGMLRTMTDVLVGLVDDRGVREAWVTEVRRRIRPMLARQIEGEVVDDDDEPEPEPEPELVI